MKRTNTFLVHPRKEWKDECLRRLMDATASLWNELTYERRQKFFNGENVWETSDYRGRYSGVLGAATVQTVSRKNDEAWKSFFALRETDSEASPPSYWGNKEDGRELRAFVRNDAYTIQWGERSRLEIVIGQDLKEEYGLGYFERLRLEVRGRPKWDGKPGRLALEYDEIEDEFKAWQPVTVDESKLHSPQGSEEAALDVGANNLVACSTTTGTQYLYEGRNLFRQFRETTEEIARLSSKLSEDHNTSRRIRRLYRKRTRRRDHAQDALVRDLTEHLHEIGVATVYVGDLAGVVRSHWAAEVNEKLHNFWAFGKLIDQLTHVCEEFAITVEIRSEAWTSQTCPECGEREATTRHGDAVRCPCGFEGHADLTASETFLRTNSKRLVRSMARPVRFQWDNHQWRSTTDAPSSGTNPDEQRTNP